MKAKERRKTQYRYSVLDRVRATRKQLFLFPSRVDKSRTTRTNSSVVTIHGDSLASGPRRKVSEKAAAKKATRVEADKAAELERQREEQA